MSCFGAPSVPLEVEEAGWKGFCTACANILSRELNGPPVLAETQVEEKIRQSKAELKEKRMHAMDTRLWSCFLVGSLGW